jgi:glycosyltransferase involved in cell wall biosynthesis
MSRPRILYVQYTNPAAYPPLEHSSRLLAAEGWLVLFLGISIKGEDDLRLPPHPSITVRQLPASSPGWRQRVHYFWFAAWVLAWVIRWRPRWIYASDAIVCPVVRVLGALPGVSIVYHEHDSPPEAGEHARDRAKHWARRSVAGRARVRILPNQQRLARFRSKVVDRQPTLCVWNCPRRDEIGPPRAAPTSERLRLLYHGSVVPSRLPLHVLEAVRGLPVQLRVIGYETQGHVGYTAELRRHAERIGVSKQLEILPGMPRYQLMRETREADVGLALAPTSSDDINLRWLAGASNKVFDYLSGGAAVLVTDLAEWRRMYVDPGFGLACQPEDPRSVAEALRWFVNHPTEARSMGERGRQRIAADWNYETQFAPVLELLTHGAKGMAPCAQNVVSGCSSPLEL